MTIAVYEVAGFNHSRPASITVRKKIAYRAELNANLGGEFYCNLPWRELSCHEFMNLYQRTA